MKLIFITLFISSLSYSQYYSGYYSSYSQDRAQQRMQEDARREAANARADYNNRIMFQQNQAQMQRSRDDADRMMQEVDRRIQERAYQDRLESLRQSQIQQAASQIKLEYESNYMNRLLQSYQQGILQDQLTQYLINQNNPYYGN